jgi:AICAR transformylase/IMP cyclohydrolase PurH
VRAIVSVWDKQGIAELAAGLHALGVELFSTGNTQPRQNTPSGRPWWAAGTA